MVCSGGSSSLYAHRRRKPTARKALKRKKRENQVLLQRAEGLVHETQGRHHQDRSEDLPQKSKEKNNAGLGKKDSAKCLTKKALRKLVEAYRRFHDQAGYRLKKKVGPPGRKGRGNRVVFTPKSKSNAIRIWAWGGGGERQEISRESNKKKISW